MHPQIRLWDNATLQQLPAMQTADILKPLLTNAEPSLTFKRSRAQRRQSFKSITDHLMRSQRFRLDAIFEVDQQFTRQHIPKLGAERQGHRLPRIMHGTDFRHKFLRKARKYDRFCSEYR